jgi:hypothetical protein
MGLQVQAPIAVTSAAYVPLTAKTFARGAAIAEDSSGSAAGLQVLWPNGNVDYYQPSQQPIIIGNIVPNGVGPLVGSPAGWNGLSAANCPATVYCQVKSMGAATTVRVSETN